MGKAEGKVRRRARRMPTRTKIVATLGPASKTLSVVRKLIRSGVDVFRINFSHGEATQHEGTARLVRRASKLENTPVAILADLQGPKIRIGKLDEPIELKKGQRFVISADPKCVPDATRVSCTYERLAKDVRPGEPILIDDGRVELKVIAVEGKDVVTRVRYDGVVSSGKGINLPGTKISSPSLTPKDLADLAVAVSLDVDYVALSFVRKAADVKSLSRWLARADCDAEVIAKIERPEAIDELDEIIDASGGVMIARGDMGVELGPEAVPGMQKRIIRHCVRAAKPVITATQMLESMTTAARPTRAEASDVANAIYDGSSALMLSGETAVGANPVLAVQTMDRIARQTEAEIFRPGKRHPSQRQDDLRRVISGGLSVAEATVAAAARAALEVDARMVVVSTETGATAKRLARERLPCRLVAMTSRQSTLRKLSLHWGIIPMLTKKARSADQLYSLAEERIRESGHGRRGDHIVIVAGTVPAAGATNTITIRKI